MKAALFDAVADLPVILDGFRLERLEFATARWIRVATVVVAEGGGAVGVGEDISYDVVDQDAHQRIAPPALSGTRTFAEWSAAVDDASIFPVPPSVPEVRHYRRWAYESALLDLALRQAGLTLGGAVGRPMRPVRYCVSPAGDPTSLLAQYPEIELKIDAQAEWTPDDMRRLAATDRVRVVDLKAHYSGAWNAHPDDPPAFSAQVAAAFPGVVIEDPGVDEPMREFVTAHGGRISFDAPVHSLADLRALPPTGWCNIKPSRFGTVRALSECIAHCEANGVAMYGGGQFEIGPGRSQIQAIASVFFPDGPNDVAPSQFNAIVIPPDLPPSPLIPTGRPGFTH